MITILCSCGETSRREVFEIESSSSNSSSSSNPTNNPSGDIGHSYKKGDDNATVSFDLVKKQQLIYTNMLGKERVISETITHIGEDGLIGDIKWDVNSSQVGGNWANSNLMQSQGLRPCENNVCNNTSLPSGWQAINEGYLIISASGTITDKNNNQYTISNQKTLSHIHLTPPKSYYRSVILPGNYTVNNTLILNSLNFSSSLNGKVQLINTNQIKLICNTGYGWPVNLPTIEANNIYSHSDSRDTVIAIYKPILSNNYVQEIYPSSSRETKWLVGYKDATIGVSNTYGYILEIGCWKVPENGTMIEN